MWLLLQMLKVNLLYNNEIWGPKHFLRIGSAVKKQYPKKYSKSFSQKMFSNIDFFKKWDQIIRNFRHI